MQFCGEIVIHCFEEFQLYSWTKILDKKHKKGKTETMLLQSLTTFMLTFSPEWLYSLHCDNSRGFNRRKLKKMHLKHRKQLVLFLRVGCWTKLCYSSSIFHSLNNFYPSFSSQLIEGNGYETRQSFPLYAFVRFFSLDPAQNVVYC